MLGNLYVISAPSGAGKSSLVKALTEKCSNVLASISYTTRAKRVGEADGIDYHFVSQATFQAMIAGGEFLEYANVFAKVSNDYYGTSRAWVDAQLKKGKHVILEIDWQGASQVFEKFEHAIGIFILPPSMTILEARLRERGRDDEHIIKERMSVAKDEIRHYDLYPHVLINDDFDKTLAQLGAIISHSGAGNRGKTANGAQKTRYLIKKLLA